MPWTLARFAGALWPPACARCGIEADDGFCRLCLADFHRIDSPCSACGLPLPCAPCPADRPGWHLDAVRAPFVYRPPLSGLVQTLKYAGQRDLAPALGSLLAAAIAPAAAGRMAVVHVPLHPRRLRQRRFNQADELARVLARRLGIRHIPVGIARRLDRPPQTELGRSRREQLSAAAFSVGARTFAGLRVAIVDDVITTAATVNALADGLRRAGAIRVEAWALARSVGGPHHADRNV